VSLVALLTLHQRKAPRRRSQLFVSEPGPRPTIGEGLRRICGRPPRSRQPCGWRRLGGTCPSVRDP